MVVTTVTPALTFSLYHLSFGDQTSFSTAMRNRNKEQVLGRMLFWWIILYGVLLTCGWASARQKVSLLLQVVNIMVPP